MRRDLRPRTSGDAAMDGDAGAHEWASKSETFARDALAGRDREAPVAQVGRNLRVLVETEVPLAGREKPFQPGLRQVTVGVVVMIAVLAAIGERETPQSALTATTIAGVVGIVAVARSKRFRSLGPSLPMVAVGLFLTRTTVGVAHYLHFFGSEALLERFGSFDYSYDYGQLPEAMETISRFWREYGFVGVPETYLGQKAFLLVAYQALLYFFGGEYILNLAPWNAFHSMMVPFVVTAFALRQNASARQARIVWWGAALQPLFLYCDLPQRDVVGQLWVVVAVYLVVSNLRAPARLVAVMPLAAVLAFSQRTVYPIVLLALVLIALVWSKRDVRTLGVVLCILLYVGSRYGAVLEEQTIGRYARVAGAQGAPSVLGAASSPTAVIVGLAGPFPWTQVLEVPGAWIHLPPEFLQAFFSMSLWMLVLPRVWRALREGRELNEGVLAAGLFFLSGVFSGAIHTGYTNIAMVWVLPLAATAGTAEWMRRLWLSAALYFVGHIAFEALGLAGQGIFL